MRGRRAGPDIREVPTLPQIFAKEKGLHRIATFVTCVVLAVRLRRCRVVIDVAVLAVIVMSIDVLSLSFSSMSRVIDVVVIAVIVMSIDVLCWLRPGPL